MKYTITEESFDNLTSYRNNPKQTLRWNTVFVLPDWLRVWWQVFGDGAELYLRAVRQGEKIIGIAPLSIRDKTASIIGGIDTCDYLDFVIVPGMERDFSTVLLDDLRQRGIDHLDLTPLRPDSTVLNDFIAIAQNQECDVSCRLEDVSLEIDLPPTWDEYLGTLTGKQQHEVKRKLRRLWGAGDVNYHIVEDRNAVHDLMDTFINLFSVSREEKANFMTTRMKIFFNSMADTMAEAGLLKLGILELDTLPAAMVLCFDYNDCVYLYNSGYDPHYGSLSVGLLSKVLCIKDSIQKGRKKFDFLRGGESYKYQLGGREVPIYSCQIMLK